ncbi:MAG: hypothetical protein HN348_35955 [Proteobacteria bacterium]|jgi:hypothetical protein|nr:hypothetical protein [Pseudomonadota bacterium]
MPSLGYCSVLHSIGTASSRHKGQPAPIRQVRSNLNQSATKANLHPAQLVGLHQSANEDGDDLSLKFQDGRIAELLSWTDMIQQKYEQKCSIDNEPTH